MDTMRLGRTNLRVSRSGFGALPIQRISFDEAKAILRKAYDNGINFFDTARAYTNSEEKIGYALADVRNDIILATKSKAGDRKTLLKDLETSLRNLKTDHVDILQLHNPAELPDPEDPESSYAGLLEARQKGLIRFLGVTNHKIGNALQAAASARYDTVQFPLNSLSAAADLKLIEVCKERDLGVIAMKALSGGLITNAATTFAFLRQYDNLVPIWGIQKLNELDEFIAFEKNPPILDEAMWRLIEKDRTELAGDFCRGCGYCMPCPVGIEINSCARMSLMIRRAPQAAQLTDKAQAMMKKIEDCLHCGKCKAKCPYGLDTPRLLEENYQDYREILAGKMI